MGNIKIAVQKSGRLHDNSIGILKDAGISIDNGIQQLKASASNFPLEIFYLRNSDIPQYLNDGVVDIAILGNNVLVEKGMNIEIVQHLGFSKCRLSLAVPSSFHYTDIEDMRGLKIATSYPQTVLNYFNHKNIDIEIHQISGSVEIAPNIGLADAVVDLVSTGSTILKNNLKEVLILLKSEAVLAISPKIKKQMLEILEQLKFRIQAVLNARHSKYILLNAPNDRVASIIDLLPVLKSPTVLPLATKGWSSVHAVIKEEQFWQVIDGLKSAGAEGILVCPIEKIIF